MEICHMARRMNDSSWTISKTAELFEVSIGLVSENLRLADALHKHPKLLTIEKRADALSKMGSL